MSKRAASCTCRTRLRVLRVCECLRGSSPLSNVSTNIHRAAIGFDCYLPIPIGPVDPRADGFEAGDHVGGGVAEGVAAAAADDGDLWMPGLQQFARRRGAAAV